MWLTRAARSPLHSLRCTVRVQQLVLSCWRCSGVVNSRWANTVAEQLLACIRLGCIWWCSLSIAQSPVYSLPMFSWRCSLDDAHLMLWTVFNTLSWRSTMRSTMATAGTLRQHTLTASSVLLALWSSQSVHHLMLYFGDPYCDKSDYKLSSVKCEAHTPFQKRL